jgi:excisionase family DNA binding protein
MSDESLLAAVKSPHEAELAKEAQRCIMMALDHSRAPKIVLVEEGKNPQHAPTLELSPLALRAVADLLGLLGRQQPVMLMPQKHELSTQEVAGFLNVSRPFVIKQIDAGKLAHRKVGRHRRVEFSELLRFQAAQKAESETALQKVVDLSQSLNLY